MLDIPAYRNAESAAKAQLPSWRILQAHRLDAFEAVGFPVRVNALSELGMLLDTMQEGRAAKYRTAMDAMGWADGEIEGAALVDQVEFVRTYFPLRGTEPAFDTIASMSCLYRKLRNAAPDFTRILEIGPGCGYLSFFLKQHQGLENYTQVEAAESFYLLQYLVGLHCFGASVEELAIAPRPAAKFTHAPWWRIETLADRRYDIVTANACLLEMSHKALGQYLTLAAAVLKPGAPFVAQCFGHNQNGNPATLAKAFEAHGFKTLSMMAPGPKRPTWEGVWERL